MRVLVALSIILIVFYSSAAYAQGEEASVDFLPPSPNAAALGEYGQIPVGLHTGTPQFNIPLYQFTAGNLSVPISLSYSSNGVKVDEMPSHVGVDWVLNAGGVITRIARDKPDKGERWVKPDASFNSDEMLDYLKNVVTYDGDAEPDIFAFNFGEYSGKFYIDENDEAVLLEPAPLDIEILPPFFQDYDPYNTGPEVKVTDGRGIVYWFGGNNAGEVSLFRSRKKNADGSPPPPYEVESAWYLNKIEHPTGDNIVFLYEKSNYRYNVSLSQEFSKLVYERIDYSSGGTVSCGNGSGNVVRPVITVANTTTAVLSEIYSSAGDSRVKFAYSPWLDSKQGILKLDSISIYNTYNNIFLKKYELTYNIVDTDNYTNGDIDHEEVDLKRLFLSEVMEVGKGAQSKPPYLLEYYSPQDLPARLSYAQDYWGYFNGKNNAYLVPRMKDEFYTSKPGDFEEVPYLGKTIKGVYQDIGGDRSPSGAHGIKGMLKKITYPTNGSNELFYEPHSYYGTRLMYPAQKEVPMKVVVNGGPEDFRGEDVVQLGLIEVDQKVEFNVSLEFNTHDQENCYEPTIPDHWKSAAFRVKNLTTGSYINLYKKAQNPPMYEVDLGDNYIFTPDTEHGIPYFFLEAGNKYQVELKVIRPCLIANASFSFMEGAPREVAANIQVGGVRIQKVVSADGYGGSLVKNYDYGTGDCMSCSSGVVENPKPGIWVYNNEKNTSSEISTCVYATLSSNTFTPLYSLQGSHIAYETVIESVGEDYQQGRTIHYFNAIQDELANVYNGDMLPGTPNSNSFGRGRKTKIEVQKWDGSQFFTVNSVTYNYTHDDRLNNQLFGYRVRKFHFLSNTITNPEGDYGTDYDITVEDPKMYDFV
jgi:hypothetical protein